ncbi:hypothetical protein F4680DRAFT_439407 [Xylaria scruposa]|nr:hypothetical protein F4680DRAFT_439407 [Xylaria scruposa]
MPLRPTPVALSGIRIARSFLPKPRNDTSETPRWARKKIWDAEIKSDDDAFERKVFEANRGMSAPKHRPMTRAERKEHKTTQELLKGSYAKALYDRVCSLMGKTQPDLRKMSRPLRIWAERRQWPPGGFQAKSKWTSQIYKFTRQVKFFRVWFLDYHVANDLGLIVERMDSAMLNRVSRESLEAQVSGAKDTMKSITCSRHVAQVTKARKQLFAIAKTLRSLEVKFTRSPHERGIGNWERFERGIGSGERIGPRRFPSSMLRAVETKLLMAEVLSMELIVRKALIEGPRIQRKAFRTLRRNGYKPDFPELPFDEPDFDEDD